MATLIQKRGDSITWKISYKQSDGITPVDLTGFIIDVDAYEKITKSILFNVVSNAPTPNMYITTDTLNIGEFSVIIKDTATFKIGNYDVDIEYIDPDGFQKSSKSFGMRVVERL